jgi:hypothetical protein
VELVTQAGDHRLKKSDSKWRIQFRGVNAMISMPSHRNALGDSVADAALFCIFAAAPSFALAQDSANDPANYACQAGAIRYAQQM